jgi:hypothetical protein
MADERFEWLDKDTADRLLRGEPVVAVDDHVRAQAARLHAALDSAARPAGYPENGELPGEKAAVEAFRRAAEVKSDALGPVRLRTAPARSRAAGLWYRPVRFGLAAAVAACTLSGVAVAAGTGLLPSPFSSPAPRPASSVSATASPGPLSPTGSGTSTVPGANAGNGAAGQQDHPRQHPEYGSAGPGSPSGTSGPNRRSPGRDAYGKADGVFPKLLEACSRYRAGRVDEDRRHTLETQAGGASKVGQFCDRVLAAGAGTRGNGSRTDADRTDGSDTGGDATESAVDGGPGGRADQ